MKWIKFNIAPVSFGTKDDSYGQFNITKDGDLITLKLIHLNGYVTNVKDKVITRSNWYSRDESTGRPLPDLGVIITDAAKKRILPEDKDIPDINTLLYQIPGYDSMSPELVFKNLSLPRAVSVAQEFQIWYYQDLLNVYESTNDGTVELDVYGLYV